MSISKAFGHPLSDRSKNGAGNSIKSTGGGIETSDFAPGSKGQGTISVNETAGGGPFHVVVWQNGKTIINNPKFIGGAIVSYCIGEKVGAKLNVSDGEIDFSITGEKHVAEIFNSFDAA
jgi:hypothetical protein